MVDALLHIEYAKPSSNRYVAQQRAVVYWRDYLQDCEGKLPYDIVNCFQHCNTPKLNYYYKWPIRAPILLGFLSAIQSMNMSIQTKDGFCD